MANALIDQRDIQTNQSDAVGLVKGAFADRMTGIFILIPTDSLLSPIEP